MFDDPEESAEVVNSDLDLEPQRSILNPPSLGAFLGICFAYSQETCHGFTELKAQPV
jgi:hypothetical protein